MKYSFHPSAKQELLKTIKYYENSREGLGIEFLIEFQRTIKRILQFPNAWSKLSKNTHRCLTNRFPYGIIYRTLKNEIIIIAVMQLNRKPNYWKSRIK